MNGSWRNRSRLLLVGIFFFALLLPFQSEYILAATAYPFPDLKVVIDARDPVKDATVNLYCRLKDGRKMISTSGSGAFIDERGIILTNAHVAQYFVIASEPGRVKGSCSVRTGSPAKETYTADLLYLPEAWIEDNMSKSSSGKIENDFALLMITDARKGELPAKFPTLPMYATGTIMEKDDISVAGYPTEGLDFEDIQKKLNAIVATSTIKNVQSFERVQSPDLLTIAPSAAGSPGISGGPVINSAGAIIGVATSKSSAKDDTTLRAITLSHVDRSIQSQTALSLRSLLVSDLASRSAATESAFSRDVIRVLENNLLRKK